VRAFVLPTAIDLGTDAKAARGAGARNRQSWEEFQQCRPLRALATPLVRAWALPDGGASHIWQPFGCGRRIAAMIFPEKTLHLSP
jgi:hypothetical protein